MLKAISFVYLVGEALFAQRNSTSQVHDVSLACNGSETSPSQCSFVSNPMCLFSNRLARLRCREGKDDIHDSSYKWHLVCIIVLPT